MTPTQKPAIHIFLSDFRKKGIYFMAVQKESLINITSYRVLNMLFLQVKTGLV